MDKLTAELLSIIQMMARAPSQAEAQRLARKAKRIVAEAHRKRLH